jgi:hypothetical protein
MELEGTLQVERRPMRRWIPIVGVIVPVVAFVAVAGWFIRAFVAPPMVAIPSPAMLAEAPPAPFETRVDMTAPQPAAAERAAPARETYTPATSMLASASTASPALATASSTAAPPPPMTTPAAATVPADPAAVAQAAAIEPGEPIQGPIPLPPRRPRVMVAQAAGGPVPLPRPRPPETTARPEPEAPPIERHTIQ